MNILFVLFACSESEKSTEMVDEPICSDIKDMSCLNFLWYTPIFTKKPIYTCEKK